MVSPATPHPAMQNVDRIPATNNTTFLIACPPVELDIVRDIVVLRYHMAMKDPILIRNAVPTDLDAIIEIDDVGPKEEKPAYWRWIFAHDGSGEKKDRIFLVAEAGGDIVGFIAGEVRAWGFGSAPCGWVFALAVSPKMRGGGDREADVRRDLPPPERGRGHDSADDGGPKQQGDVVVLPEPGAALGPVHRTGTGDRLKLNKGSLFALFAVLELAGNADRQLP